MSIMQVRDILKLIRGVYRRLGNVVADVLPRVSDDRTRNVLRTLLKHDRAIEAALQRSESVSQNVLMQTWIQFTPDKESLTLVDESAFTSDMKPEDVLEQTARIEESLIAVYRRLSEQSSAPSVVDFFEQLAKQTGRRLNDMSWRIRDGHCAPRSFAVRGTVGRRDRKNRPSIASPDFR